MRMSSTVKKGDKGKSQSSSNPAAALPLSKDGSAVKTTTNSKAGEAKNVDNSNKDQLNPKLLPTAEQLRIAQMISDSKRDDPELPDKVNKLVELTQCSSDAAIIALHDSNNDLDQAIVALLDGETEGDWEVSGKKKKPKQLTQTTATGSDGTESGTNNGTGVSGGGRGRDRERSRSGRGGPPRLRGRGGRGGRDNKENVEDGDGADALGGGSRGRGSRGPRMSNGPGGREGGPRGRGGRGGSNSGAYRDRRGGPRPAQSDSNWDDGLTNVEPWVNNSEPGAPTANSEFPSTEEWDNEEYIGSLVETKVFTPSSSTVAPTSGDLPAPGHPTLMNGSVSSAPETSSSVPQPQIHYSTLSSGAAGQGIDLNALLQKTSGVTLAGSSGLQQQFHGQHHYNQQQATNALKAVMGVGSSSATANAKSVKPLRAKIPPPSKIPSSAVEMPDDSSVSGLDVKFGTLDFGFGQSGFDDMPMMPSSSTASSVGAGPGSNSHGMPKQPDHQHNHHSLMSSSKMEHQQQYGGQQQQPPAASSLPKPDPSLGGFSSAGSVSSSAQQSMQSNAPAQAKTVNSGSAYSAYGGNSYAPPGVNSSSQASSSAGNVSQPAGAYPSGNQTSGVYSSGTTSSVYQGTGNQNSAYASYGQQQQPSSNYQGYNNKMSAADATNSSVSTSLQGMAGSVASAAASRSTVTTTAKPAATQAGATGLPNLPPGVPTMLGPGGFIMGQAPGLPYYAAAAAAAAGIQQHPVYSLEDMQYRYGTHLAAGYYDMGYGQSPTSLGTGREGTLASLAYATSSDAKFSRNENNSPVPTSLSQNAAQSHGGAFITPAAAAPAPLTPAYAYYYSGGVMPGGYQFGAPAALYPVSATTPGHAGGGANTANQYGKAGGPLGGSVAGGGAQSGGQAGQASSGGNASSGVSGAQSNATGGTSAGGYGSYGSTYDEFSKSVYGSVSAGGQAAKMGAGSGGPTGGVGGAGSSGDLGGVGPNVYSKTHNQLGKINTYDKTGAFHTGTPPPYGLSGNASGAPLGVGVSVGVGGPSPYGGQHMFIPTLAPHQSQHSHLMHQQLHQDSSSGPGQRSQTGGQQNKQGSKPSYGGSYWGSN